MNRRTFRIRVTTTTISKQQYGMLGENSYQRILNTVLTLTVVRTNTGTTAIARTNTGTTAIALTNTGTTAIATTIAITNTGTTVVCYHFNF